MICFIHFSRGEREEQKEMYRLRICEMNIYFFVDVVVVVVVVQSEVNS